MTRIFLGLALVGAAPAARAADVLVLDGQDRAEIVEALIAIAGTPARTLHLEVDRSVRREVEEIAGEDPDLDLVFVDAGTPTLRTDCRVFIDAQAGGAWALSMGPGCSMAEPPAAIVRASDRSRTPDWGPVRPRTLAERYERAHVWGMVDATFALVGGTAFLVGGVAPGDCGGFCIPPGVFVAFLGVVHAVPSLLALEATSLGGASLLRARGLKVTSAPGLVSIGLHLGALVSGAVWLASDADFEVRRMRFYVTSGLLLGAAVAGVTQLAINDLAYGRGVASRDAPPTPRFAVSVAFVPEEARAGRGRGVLTGWDARHCGAATCRSHSSHRRSRVAGSSRVHGR